MVQILGFVLQVMECQVANCSNFELTLQTRSAEEIGDDKWLQRAERRRS